MDDNDNVFSLDASGVKKWRTGIKVLAYLVYLAGALFATITFSQHVSNQFPAQPILYLMAFAGAWANFFSLGIMPIAKEYWVSGTSMTIAAWAFWVIEFLIVVLNTLAAYGSDWAAWWTSLSPASPVIVIGIWGMLWYLNPEAKAHQDQVNFYLEAQKDFQNKLRRSMKSAKIQQIMDDGAAQAAEQFAENTLKVVIDPTRKADVKAASSNGRVREFNASSPAADRATGEVGISLAGDTAPIVQGREDGVKADPTKRRR